MVEIDMSQILAAVILSAISAVSALSSAIISWLNKKAIQNQPVTPPAKTNNPSTFQ